MPTYEYSCKDCGEHLEVVQSFKDDALTACPACGGALRKVFGAIGVVFKGNGFYKTDSRPKSSESTKAGKSEASSSSPSSAPSSSSSSSSDGGGTPAPSADAKVSTAPASSGSEAKTA